MGLEKLLENTPEAYYWIGYSFADATIVMDKNGNRKQYLISCKWDDRNHLRKLAKFLNTHILSFDAKFNGKLYKQASIKLRGSESITKLIEKFDFRKRKTYNPPENLNIKSNDLFLSFLIGYIDGDGCIHKRDVYLLLKISCHKSWNAFLKKCFNRARKIFNQKIKDQNSYIKENIVIFRIIEKTFIKELKKEAIRLGLPTLNRKWDKVNIKEIEDRACKRELWEKRSGQLKQMISKGLTAEEICLKTGHNRKYVKEKIVGIK